MATWISWAIDAASVKPHKSLSNTLSLLGCLRWSGLRPASQGEGHRNVGLWSLGNHVWKNLTDDALRVLARYLPNITALPYGGAMLVRDDRANTSDGMNESDYRRIAVSGLQAKFVRSVLGSVHAASRRAVNIAAYRAISINKASQPRSLSLGHASGWGGPNSFWHGFIVSRHARLHNV